MELLTGKGRIGRLRYFLSSIVLSVLLVMALAPGIRFDPITGEPELTTWALIVAIAGLWPSLMLAVRRLHDLGWTGLLVLILFVPIIGGLFGLVLLFMPGDKAPNRYGSPHGEPEVRSAAEHRLAAEIARREAAEAYAARH